MQQTQKYKLNLIERDDPFLPEGLNANTQKVEDLISAHQEEVKTVTDNLDARVAVFEAKKFAWGTFRMGSEQTAVDLGFAPFAVLIQQYSHTRIPYLQVRGNPEPSSYIKLLDNGFSACVSGYGGIYTYLAFG